MPGYLHSFVLSLIAFLPANMECTCHLDVTLDGCEATQTPGPHSEKKGYRNSAPGVLLLQIVPFFRGALFFP